MPALPLTGGCLCGGVRYEIDEPEGAGNWVRPCEAWRWQDRGVFISCVYWLFRHLRVPETRFGPLERVLAGSSGDDFMLLLAV